jgi:predicted ABC-class ATPase
MKKTVAMKNLKIAFISLAVSGLALSFAGCKKTFDKEPQQVLDITNMYRDVYDADAAVTGLYGKFMGLSDRYIMLNELRADMLNYTENADEYIRQISTHSVSSIATTC